MIVKKSSFIRGLFILILGFLLSGCQPSSILLHSYEPGELHIAAHRGYHTQVPGNSIASIEQAIEYDIDIVEVDVRISKDGVPVLMHDDNIKRTTNGSGNVSDFSVSALKEFRLLNKGEITDYTIPTFAEALEIGKGKVLFDIDIKTAQIEKIIGVVEDTDADGSVFFFDSDWEVLEKVRQKHQSWKIMPRAYNENEAREAYKKFKPWAVHVDPSFASAELADYLHKRGVHVWINALGDVDEALRDGKENALQPLLETKSNIIQTDVPVLVKRIAVNPDQQQTDHATTFPSGTDTAKLIRRPYLQTVLADSITIRWKSNRGKSCYIKYGKTTQMGRRAGGTVTNQQNSVMNEVTIKELDPETKYYYQVYTNGRLLAGGENYYFRTSPSDKEEAFSFFAMGDIGMPTEDGGYPEVTADRIDRLEQQPDFGLLLGDLVYYDGESKYYDKRFFEPLSAILKNTPVYPVPGNHDWRSIQSFEQEWKLPNNEHYYSFKYGNTLFVGLDSKNGQFFEFEKQKKWLKQMLRKANGQYDWIIVYLHFNGRSCTEKKDVKEVISLYPVFANNGVDVVLNGHAHTYERLHPYDGNGKIITEFINNIHKYDSIEQGFISITMGAGGDLRSDWMPGKCEQKQIVASSRHVGHFSRFTIDNNNLKMEAISSLTGEIFDEFVINK